MLSVRAKRPEARSKLLSILRQGDLPCQRLFLDYRGLRLIHSWMVDFSITDRMCELRFRYDILQTLEILPIANKTMLQDSKVLQSVERWSKKTDYIEKKPSGGTNDDESSRSDSGSGTPTLDDDNFSPKIDESSSVVPSVNSPSIPIIDQLETPLQADAETEKSDSLPLADVSPTETAASPIVSSASIPKQNDVLKSIPQIIEQSSALKGMGVDILKRIISTNEKNNKIIEDSERNDKLPDGELGKLIREVRLLALKLVSTWEQLPESFRIPKKMRIEQMKEHEREADQGYKNTLVQTEPTDAVISSRFQERFRERERDRNMEIVDIVREKDPRRNRYKATDSTLQKMHRRQMFEAKV